MRSIYLIFILFVYSLPIFAASELLGLRTQTSPKQTRFIFIFSATPHYQVDILTKPNRLLLDFKNTNLSIDLSALKLEGTFVSGLRHIQRGENIQLVLDVPQPLQYQSRIINKKYSVELSIDVKPAPSLPNLTKTKSPVVPRLDRGAQVSPTVTSSKLSAVLKSTRTQQRFVIAVDAGHGGHDTGAIGADGAYEKDVTLSVALKLAKWINKQPNMKAVLTRNGDYFVPLRKRMVLARKANADLFVAIHADAEVGHSAQGASVYALSEHGATKEAARWLAQRENYEQLDDVALKELQDQSPVVRSVLIDMAQNATISESLSLGSTILDALDNIASLHYTRVEQAPFMVLKSPDIPSILVELGYLSNPKEEKRLISSKYQDQLAQALLSGVREYLAADEKKKYL